MDLTGTPVILVVGVLVVIGCVRLVTGGPRPRRRGVRVMTRTAEVLGLNLAVLVLAGLLLNDQYLFYSSWADFFGARSSEVVSHAGGTTSDVIGSRIAGPGLEAHLPRGPLPPLPDPGKRVQDFVVHDRYARTGRRCSSCCRLATTPCRARGIRSSWACTASPAHRPASRD